MADVIDFEKHRYNANLITHAPLEFRWGEWRSGPILLCVKREAYRFEEHRQEATKRPGHRHVAWVPNRLKLTGGPGETAAALFRYRTDEGSMRRVYRLAGMMECITRGRCPVLRSDLLRRFYEAILKERNALRVTWRGPVDRYLLPLYPVHSGLDRLLSLILPAATLKDLLKVIEAETRRQFDLLAEHYVFYVPRSFREEG